MNICTVKVSAVLCVVAAIFTSLLDKSANINASQHDLYSHVHSLLTVGICLLRSHSCAGPAGFFLQVNKISDRTHFVAA